MKLNALVLATCALALAPVGTLAKPPGQGSTHGTGWDHLNGPTETGQPGLECGEEGATFSPGHAASAPGSPFNEDGNAGTRYAGEQPQNSRNRASVSQYDTACHDRPK